jgi:hypothetical protein
VAGLAAVLRRLQQIAPQSAVTGRVGPALASAPNWLLWCRPQSIPAGSSAPYLLRLNYPRFCAPGDQIACNPKLSGARWRHSQALRRAAPDPEAHSPAPGGLAGPRPRPHHRRQHHHQRRRRRSRRPRRRRADGGVGGADRLRPVRSIAPLRIPPP